MSTSAAFQRARRPEQKQQREDAILGAARELALEHGVPRGLHAWFEIEGVEGGTRIHHVEELDLGHGPLGWLHDMVAGQWFARSVDAEVAEIGRLLEAGERGDGVAGRMRRKYTTDSGVRDQVLHLYVVEVEHDVLFCRTTLESVP